MGTFRQSNKLATVGLIFGLFIGGGSSAFANPQISPLDPDYLKPPGTGTGKQAKKEMLPETTALSTTYTNVDGNDNGPLKMPHSKKKFSLKGHDSADNIVSTKVEKVKVPKEEKDKTKEAKAKTKEAKVASTKDSDGVVGGTKAASAKLGDGMANGTKKVGDGLTSGAKASGSFFMKGAKAIGSGLKGADKDKTASSSPSKKASAEKLAEEKRPAEEPKKVAKRNDFEEQDKVKSKSKEKAKLDQTDDKKKKGLLSPISNTFKDGLHAATDKLSLTKPSSAEAITAKAEHSTKQAKSKAKADESTYISHGKPVKKAKEAKQASGPGLVSKTFGKLPFVGGSKKNSGEDVQKVAKSDGDDALVSDPPVKSAGRTEEETPLGPSL